ncbi:hypothetical protein [Clostridium sp.]|nr:hypothetical protein [Clostridium sp.]
MDEKIKEEKVLEKVIEYYFNGFKVNEAVTKAIDEVKKEYEAR